MKFLFAVVTLSLLAIASATPVLSDEKNIVELLRDGILHRAYEQELRELMEKFRVIMETGYEPLNIPILAPYQRETLDINVDSPPTANISIKFSNFSVSGLESFEVTTISMNLIPIRMNFNMNIPQIDISASLYKLDGSIMDNFKLFGNGKFDMSATNLTVKGNATIVIRDGFLFMSKFLIDMSMDKLKSDIQGLLGGGEVSVVMNEIMQELIPSVIVSYNHMISDLVGNKVMTFVNPHLSKLTLNDIIDLITGNKPM